MTFHSESATQNCLRHRLTDAPDPEGFQFVGVETLKIVIFQRALEMCFVETKLPPHWVLPNK